MMKVSWHLTKAVYKKDIDTLFLSVTKRKQDTNTFMNESLQIVLGKQSIARLRTALDDILTGEKDLV